MIKSLILAIDSGNTTVNFALIKEGEIQDFYRCSNSPNRAGDEYYAWLLTLLQQRQLNFADIVHCVISSVVPQALENLVAFAERAFGNRYSIFHGAHPALGMKVMTVEKVGSDMLANCIGAYEYYGRGNIIVADSGTATTFSFIDDEGSFQGCMIAPGLKTSLNALCAAGALLPPISFQKPMAILGINTVECIEAGIYFGYKGLLENNITVMREEVCRLFHLQKNDIKIMITGGYSQHFESDLIDDRDPHLLLKGLWHFYARQQQLQYLEKVG